MCVHSMIQFYGIIGLLLILSRYCLVLLFWILIVTSSVIIFSLFFVNIFLYHESLKFYFALLFSFWFLDREVSTFSSVIANTPIFTSMKACFLYTQTLSLCFLLRTWPFFDCVIGIGRLFFWVDTRPFFRKLYIDVFFRQFKIHEDAYR